MNEYAVNKMKSRLAELRDMSDEQIATELDHMHTRLRERAFDLSRAGDNHAAMVANITADVVAILGMRLYRQTERPSNLCRCGQPGEPRVDNGLSAGIHCDACWESMVAVCRQRSW